MTGLCILPLGNSITQADTSHDSYRYPLWKKLIDAQLGNTTRFTGSMLNFFGDELGTIRTKPDYKGYSFPPNHEGHWGWTVDQVLSNSARRDSSGSGNIDLWMQGYACDPNCVLLHLGTNDISRNPQDVSSTIAELRELMRRIDARFGQDVNLTFLLGLPIPSCSGAVAAKLTPALRDADLGCWLENTSSASLALVDLATGFENSMLYDGCHPDSVGEEFMAARWLEGVLGGCLNNPGYNVPRYTYGGGGVAQCQDSVSSTECLPHACPEVTTMASSACNGRPLGGPWVILWILLNCFRRL